MEYNYHKDIRSKNMSHIELWDDVIVKGALFFAIKKHDGQTMKDPKYIPYTAHFIGVTLNAIKYALLDGKEINWNLLVCCALLHDTLEDTATTYEEIKSSFNEDIAKGVLALSKNPKIKYKEQMKDCIERIKQCPKEIAMVKMADRIFNLSGKVSTWSKERTIEYRKEAEYIQNELGYVSHVFSNALLEAIKKY